MELEQRKAEIEPKLVPLTQKAETVIERLGAIKETIAQADKTKLASLCYYAVTRARANGQAVGPLARRLREEFESTYGPPPEELYIGPGARRRRRRRGG